MMLGRRRNGEALSAGYANLQSGVKRGGGAGDGGRGEGGKALGV